MDSLARVGEPAPDFQLPDLDGRMRSPRQARGHVLVLNFWSVECPHSARLDQAMAGLLAGWGENVEVWSIAPNAREDVAMLRAAAEARGVKVVLRDARQATADAYGAQATPHVFIVDKDGILRYDGAPDDTSFRQRTPTRDYLREAVEALLAGRQPDPAVTRAFGCAITRSVAGR